jgi:hypothetical protein
MGSKADGENGTNDRFKLSSTITLKFKHANENVESVKFD